MIAGVPRQGGATWAVLQYVLGLRRLGHDVIFVEPVDRLEDAAPYFDRVVRAFALDAGLVERRTGRIHGIERRRLYGGADLVLNLSGRLDEVELLGTADRRVFVDLDPAFTQLWFAAGGLDVGFDHHDRFVTVGPALGTPTCRVPTCGLHWIATAPPIVLDHWPVATGRPEAAATTVGHWRGYGSIVDEHVHYGQRAHSMRQFFDVAQRAGNAFHLALGIDPQERDDLDALDRHGWKLIDPDTVAGTPDDYRTFVQGSWAEIGIAKSGYVVSRSGWFSDRSVCYLASGRPVVAQDTGFSEWLPVGSGLLAFSTADEAVAGFEELARDYPAHRRAARQLAEEVFCSDRVLTRLLACL
jgi:hypothetical protein